MLLTTVQPNGTQASWSEARPAVSRTMNRLWAEALLGHSPDRSRRNKSVLSLMDYRLSLFLENGSLRISVLPVVSGDCRCSLLSWITSFEPGKSTDTQWFS